MTTITTERPIIFSTSMVKAIEAGIKTQTRRIVKISDSPRLVGGQIIDNEACFFVAGQSKPFKKIKCPWCPGDRLWVREAWAAGGYGPIHRASYSHPDMVMWKPSIHMKREIARIFLEVTAVRVELLNDIGNIDAFAEGVPPNCDAEPVDVFLTIWNDINGVGAWQKNPWVWVIEFRRVK